MRHGIAKQKSGTITIRVTPDGLIQIGDDSAGEFADELLTRSFSSKTGIRNTHMRLKKQYGSNLTIQLAPNEGIRFSLPL